MSPIRSTWLKFCRWALAVLGISAVVSCEEIIDDILPAAEYGCPSMDFEIKGKVVNSENGDGIEGIRVSVHENDYGSVLSGKGGEFVLNGSEFPQDSLKLFATDIDGQQNGLFQDTELMVGLSKEKDGDKSWYEGKYSASGIVIEMQGKEDASSADE